MAASLGNVYQIHVQGFSPEIIFLSPAAGMNVLSLSLFSSVSGFSLSLATLDGWMDTFTYHSPAAPGRPLLEGWSYLVCVLVLSLSRAQPIGYIPSGALTNVGVCSEGPQTPDCLLVSIWVLLSSTQLLPNYGPPFIPPVTLADTSLAWNRVWDTVTIHRCWLNWCILRSLS